MSEKRIKFSVTKEIVEVSDADTGVIFIQVPTKIFLTAGRMQQDIANYLTYELISMAAKEALEGESIK